MYIYALFMHYWWLVSLQLPVTKSFLCHVALHFPAVSDAIIYITNRLFSCILWVTCISIIVCFWKVFVNWFRDSCNLAWSQADFSSYESYSRWTHPNLLVKSPYPYYYSGIEAIDGDLSHEIRWSYAKSGVCDRELWQPRYGSGCNECVNSVDTNTCSN